MVIETKEPRIVYSKSAPTDRPESISDLADQGKAIDWSKIRTRDDLTVVTSKLLYEDTKVYSPNELLHMRQGLSEEEIDDALFWAKFRRGIMMITSPPRQGKSTLEHLVAYKMNYYFEMLPILDTRPRSLFGIYVPFSQEMLDEQIVRMDLLEKGRGRAREDGSWETERGDIFLRNAVIGLDEFGSKYMNRRDPPNLPIKRSLLKLFDYWGHSQCLWLCSGISIDDMDRRCLDKIVWEARCTRIFDAEECYEDPSTIIIGAWISPTRYNPYKDQMEVAGEPIPLRINSSKPQKCLAGSAWKDIFKTDNVQGFTLSKKRNQ